MNEQEYKEHINEKASKVETQEQLNELLKEIIERSHSYDSIVNGCFAGMVGAFNVINRSENGGITGFQAGYLGWAAIEKFMSIEAPARILDFNKLLYLQHEDDFAKTISKEAWLNIQGKAEKNIKDHTNAHPDVIAHWQSIVAGKVPFDYIVTEE